MSSTFTVLHAFMCFDIMKLGYMLTSIYPQHIIGSCCDSCSLVSLVALYEF